MRILVAPDKLKGSLSAVEAARALVLGIRDELGNAEVELCPLADGGDGTLDALEPWVGGSPVALEVRGPSGSPRSARYLWNDHDGRALVESAEAIGLASLGGALPQALRTTSFGVGELVLDAVERGAREVVVGLGGSATTDGGAGFAQALGVRFHDAPTPIMGGDLETLRAVDRSSLTERVRGVRFTAACDVNNPLSGPRGAARVYAAQKGASPEQALALDRGLCRLAELVPEVDSHAPGCGAAGGLGFGIAAFVGGRLLSGADFVLDALDFDARLARVDWVVTGEGRLDSQTLSGKLVARVIERARRARVRSAVVAGSVRLDAAELDALGADHVEALARDAGAETRAMADAERMLRERGAELARSVLFARRAQHT